MSSTQQSNKRPQQYKDSVPPRRCSHCGQDIVNGIAKKPKAPPGQMAFSNKLGQPLIVLGAVPPTDKYYGEFVNEITDFHVTFAESVLHRDNILVIVPERHSHVFREHLPADTLLHLQDDLQMADIWMRDFSPVGMRQQVMFKYKPNYMKTTTANYIQNRLSGAIKAIVGSGSALLPKQSSLTIDGGNVVDNHIDKAILCGRVLTDNKGKHVNEIKQQIRNLLNYDYVAVIPDDETRTGHADGMVAFIDDDVIAISAHLDDQHKDEIYKEFAKEFKGRVKIIEIRSDPADDKWRKFESACGLHVNMVATHRYLYVPVFGHDHRNQGQSRMMDEKVLDQIVANTTKTVVPIEVDQKICRMGGNCRCLSWQVSGPLADAFIKKARNDAKKYDPKFEKAVEPTS